MKMRQSNWVEIGECVERVESGHEGPLRGGGCWTEKWIIILISTTHLPKIDIHDISLFKIFKTFNRFQNKI